MFKKKQNRKKNAGFTLIELLVVIAIMSIIMLITLSDYAGMNKRIEVQNTAYDIALSIRETQIYGTNKKILGNEGFSDGDEHMFGIYLDKTEGGKYEVISFKDLDNDKKFKNDCTAQPSPTKECQIKSELPRGIHITNLIVYSSPTYYYSKDKVLILFKRPNPDALIKEQGERVPYNKLCIEIKSKDEKYEAAIKVGIAGDVSVANSCN